MTQALYVPDGLYQRLVEVARARGLSAEELLRAILTEGIERESVMPVHPSDGNEPEEDPLAPFIGPSTSGREIWRRVTRLDSSACRPPHP